MHSRTRFAVLSAWFTAAMTVLTVSHLVAQDLPFSPKPISPIPHLDDLDPNHGAQLQHERALEREIYHRALPLSGAADRSPQQTQRPLNGLFQEYSAPAEQVTIQEEVKVSRSVGEPIKAMLDAAQKLEASGLLDMARELRQRAEVAERELKKREQVPKTPDEQLRQLSREMSEFRAELKSMNAKLQRLIQLMETRMPDAQPEKLVPLTPQAVDPDDLPAPAGVYP